jgi:methyl-accepting chemotaxis protein
MKFRRDATLTLAIAIVIVVTGAAFLTSRLFSGMTDDVEKSQFTLMQAIVETAIKEAENKALARADLIADLPNVQRLFGERDRAGLLAELSAVYTNQKARYGVDQTQFHLPPATSFLRLHDPATFGDDLTLFRPMVVAVNRLREPSKGITIARNGPAIFGVTPVFDTAGKHIGSLEVGIDFGPLLAGLKTAYGLDLALFIDEQGLKDFAKGADPAVLSEENRVGRYIRFKSTNAALMGGLVAPADIAIVNEAVNYIREAQGIVRGVTLLPLNNSAGAPVGIVAVTSDFSSSRAAVNRSNVWQALITVLSILTLIGVVIVVIKGFLIRPLQVLGNGFDRLSANESLEPIAGAARFPEELQAFVRLYDKVRTRRSPGAPSS